MLFTHTMKDIYNALEYKLSQADKKKLKAQSSLSLKSVDKGENNLEKVLQGGVKKKEFFS